MDNLDAELIRRMCKDFNILLAEIDGMFDLEGLVQIEPPTEDNGQRWTVYTVHVRPGRLYMSNGDPGYPDEVDVDPHSDYETCLQALVEAVKICVTTRAFDINCDLGMMHDMEEEKRIEQSDGQDLQPVSEQSERGSGLSSHSL